MKKILRTTTILLLVNIIINLYMPYSFGVQAHDGGWLMLQGASSSSGSSSQMDHIALLMKKQKISSIEVQKVKQYHSKKWNKI